MTYYKELGKKLRMEYEENDVSIDPITKNWIVGGVDTQVCSAGEGGKSAYEIWLEQGNIGTEEDFIDSLTTSNNIELGTIVENEYIGFKGVFKPYEGWSRTDYIELPIDATKIEINCDNTNEADAIWERDSRWNAFYDANKNFISMAYYGVNTIPYNAKYVTVSWESSASISIKKITDDIEIIELNRDIENALIQSSAKRRADIYEVLTIAHISDIHGQQDLFNRMVEFTNYYNSYLKLIINTGDSTHKGQEEFVDLISNAEEVINLHFYNVVGNHDQYVSNSDRSQAPKSTTYANVITKTQREWQDWKETKVTYMSGDNSMTYYRDFDLSKIRLIILDDYYDVDTQVIWLAERLEEAKTMGFAVITAKHEKTDNIATPVGHFNSKDTWVEDEEKYNTTFEAAIKDFMDTGGIYICNLCGHEHLDEMGYTSNGILNVVVECATDDTKWQNNKRDKNTKTYDCFNIISVDTNQGLLKIVRIGDNTDIYMREKKSLCYDYINKEIV